MRRHDKERRIDRLADLKAREHDLLRGSVRERDANKHRHRIAGRDIEPELQAAARTAGAVLLARPHVARDSGVVLLADKLHVDKVEELRRVRRAGHLIARHSAVEPVGDKCRRFLLKDGCL